MRQINLQEKYVKAKIVYSEYTIKNLLKTAPGPYKEGGAELQSSAPPFNIKILLRNILYKKYIYFRFTEKSRASLFVALGVGSSVVSVCCNIKPAVVVNDFGAYAIYRIYAIRF